MYEFNTDEELVNPLGDQRSSSADLNLHNEQFRTDSVVAKREKKFEPNEIIELDDDYDDRCREGPGPVNMRALDSPKSVDIKVSRKSSIFLKEEKNDVVPIETVDLDDDDEESIQSSVNMSDMDTTDTVEEKPFFNYNIGVSHSSLNDVPCTASQDISSISADFEMTAVSQGSSNNYYVNCEHCSLEEIRSDRYIYHCSKFHAEFFKDAKVECTICGKLVHHVLTNHHARLFHDGETSSNQSSETPEGIKRESFETSEDSKRESFEISEDSKRESFETSEDSKRESYETSEDSKRESFETSVDNKRESFETSEDSKRWSYRLFFLEVSPERGAKTSQSKCMKCLLCKSGKLLHAASCKRHFKTYHVSNKKYRKS